MFAYCADPNAIEGLSWLLCYLTTGKHLLLYGAVGTVVLLLAIAAAGRLAHLPWEVLHDGQEFLVAKLARAVVPVR